MDDEKTKSTIIDSGDRMGTGARRKTILIVEDNELNREMLTALLEEENYIVLTAEDGELGLAMLLERPEIELVFLDANMPVCDGFEFLERKGQNPSVAAVPVIMTTGSTRVEDEVRSLELGAVDFITKPYNAQVVLRKAQNILKLKDTSYLLSLVEIDELSGLYTMQAFCHHAAEILSSEMFSSLDLIVCDIQDFKLINSIFGEKKGDEILQYLGKVFLQQSGSGIAGRSGDRFYYLYPSRNRISENEWTDLIAKIMKDAPLQNLVFKLGAYNNIDTSQPISIICDRALMAVATIKNNFTKTMAYYDDEISERKYWEQKMEFEFDSAIEEEQFVVWFQPKVDVKSERIVAAEALVRWVDSSGHMIPPGAFITLFEQDGLIGRLDEYVFKKVCQFQKQRMDEGKTVVPISVNLSRSSTFRRTTGPNYARIVKDNGIPINFVPLELTESATTDNKRMAELADELHQCGFSLHMDDFGAGYSSMASLSTLPFEVIKLDKTLVDQIGNKKGDIVMKHTIQIAQELGMKVVAEGVESTKQVDFLREAGCDLIQGYFYSPPKKPEIFEAMLDK